MTDETTSQDHLLNALGALVVSFSALEESLHDAIVMLAVECDMATVNVLTAGLQFRSLVEKFGALCTKAAELRVPPTDVHKYCTLVLRLNEERNRYVHSAWGITHKDTGHRRFKRSAKAKSGFQLDIQDVSSAEILDLAERLRQAEQKLWEIRPMITSPPLDREGRGVVTLVMSEQQTASMNWGVITPLPMDRGVRRHSTIQSES